MVVVPTVLFFNHSVFIILALNILMYIVLFQGNIFSKIIHLVGVYLLTNMAESMVFSIGVILLSPSLKHSEISTIRSGEFSLFFAVVITGFILYIVHKKWTQNFILYFRSLNWFQYLVITMIVCSGILLLGIITIMPEYLEDKKDRGMRLLQFLF